MNLYNSAVRNAARISFVWRVVLCLIFPPLAVFDKGCFSVLLVYFLTLAGCGTGLLLGWFIFSFVVGWIPASLVALLICAASNKTEPATEENGEDSAVETVPMQLTARDVLILIFRYLLCMVAPPLAVLDKGCGAFLYVLLFTLTGWLPGVILAFLICLKDKNYYARPVEGETK